MRSLWIVTHNLAAGGCERVIAQLAGCFAEAGLAVTVATEYECEAFYPLHAKVRRFSMLSGSACPSRAIPRAYGNLRRAVRRARPDAVLAMPEKVNVWTVLFLLGSGVPVIVSERNDPRRHPESRLKRLLRRLVYPFAAGFVFQTAQAAAYFPESVRGRAAILDNPLSLDRIGAAWTGPRDRRIVFVGRLERQKNAALLLTAFARFRPAHPDWTLQFYGDGSERQSLAALAETLSLTEAMRFFGTVEDVADRIRSAGIFALPSDFEGMPNALLEAMALGLPAVATDCPAGGCASLIAHGSTGLLVPAGDADALAAALCALADAPERAAALGRAAREASVRFESRTVAEKWRRYLESCL